MSPSNRDWRLYADDIIESCGKVRRFIAGMTYEAFVADERTRDAVIRNLEVIGEAAKNLPDEVIGKAPEVEWRKVRGMRDVIAHGYFGLDMKVVWDTAKTKVDELQAAVRKLMA
ncbi:MAG: DUF86 domain-containing protein [Anaeromyxobacteraceae bacterium]|nr:DUF86 domain-containing protein [Anaeromyxobacteraceae bacterium]